MTERGTSVFIRCAHGAPTGSLRSAVRLFLLACMMGTPSGGCAARGTPMTRPDFETRIGLLDTAGKEAREFPAGAVITIVVTIRNQAADARTLTLPSAQTHDVVLTDAGHKEVWRYSRGRMFAQVIVDLTLKPGESRSYTTTWNQTDAKGKPLPPGDYEAVGFVPGGAPGCRSDTVPFTIRPS